MLYFTYFCTLYKMSFSFVFDVSFCSYSDRDLFSLGSIGSVCMPSFLKKYVSLVFHVLFHLNTMKARKMRPSFLRKNFLIGCALCVLFHIYISKIFEIPPEKLYIGSLERKERGEEYNIRWNTLKGFANVRLCLLFSCIKCAHWLLSYV